MPVIEDLLPELRNAKVFSLCNVKDGYWHVKLSEPFSYLTTFETPYGRYRWLRMLFGISPASEYFQYMLDQTLEGLPGIHTIADDILVTGEGETHEEAVKDHDRKLEGLLSRCRSKGIRLNRSKLKLRCKKMPYIGHLLTSDGLKPDPAKIEAIVKMDRPNDVPGVRRILGLVNYMSKFLNKLADISDPLNQLTHKDTEFQWTSAHDEAFETIKKAVTEAPILKYFNSSEETILQCDASSIELGAVVMQGGRPVMYASRHLTPSEQHYTQIEKELLAIVFGMEKFHQFTSGRKILVQSDHKPLEIICKKPLINAPKRLQSMLLQLQCYDYEVQYKKGTELYTADTLSRAPVSTSDTRSSAETLTEHVNMVDYLPISASRIQEIRQATENDANPKILKDTILAGWPEDKHQVSENIRVYFKLRDELSVQDGIIFRSSRCVIPECLLAKIHSSHLGIESCLKRARECIYWPLMSQEIKDYK